MMNKIKYIPLILVLFFIAIWGGSIIKCEITTVQHGKKFTDLYKDTNMISSVDYLKVLNYSDTSARIYYVSKGGMGNIITVIKQDGQWAYDKWETVWSTSGSADEFVFPYIHHSATGIALLAILGIPAILITIVALCIGSKRNAKSAS